MKVIKPIASLLLLVSSTLLAQVPAVQVGPSNDTGIARVGSMAVPMGSVNLTNGNLSLAVPLVTLPSRGGSGFTLALLYNSKIWTPHVSYTNGGNDLIAQWKFERVQHQVGDLGWQLNLPYLDGGEWLESNGSTWGMGAFVITMPDGSKHSIAGFQSGLDSEDGDGMNLQYTMSGSNPTDMTVTSADGLHYHFTGIGTTADRVTDRNGNYISIDSSTNTITTSAGFQITLDTVTTGFGTYYSGVHYKDGTNTTRNITLGFSNLGLFSTNSSSQYYTGSGNPFTYPQSSGSVCDAGVHCYSHVYVTQPNTAANYAMLTSITMPDGSGYSFTYNGWGELKQVNYPGGGYARYEFPTASSLPTVHAEGYWYDHGTIPADFRQVRFQYLCPKSSCTSAEEIETKYDGVVDPSGSGTPWLMATANNVTNTVTVKLNNALKSKALHNYTLSVNNENGYLPPFETSVINYATDGTTPLSATTTTYLTRNGTNFLPQAVTQFVCNSSSSAVSSTTTYDYDSASFHVLEPTVTPYTSKMITYDTIPIGSNVTLKKVYDFVSRSNCGTTAPSSYGTLLRQDAATFKSGDSNYGPASSAHLLTLPAQQTVYDGSSAIQAQTTYEYDVHTGAYHASLASTSGAPQHTSAPGSRRGNVTGVTRRVDASNTVTTNTQYNDAGLVVASIDGRHNTTSYSYGSGYLYPTQVNSPVSGISDYYGYNAYTGQMEWHRGPNSPNPGEPQTSYSYDSSLRLTMVTYPDSGGVTFTHNPNWVLQRTTSGTASALSYIYNCILYDGLGRQVETQQLTGSVSYCSSATGASGSIFTKTTYDALGLVGSVSNPYRAGDSVVWTSNGRDGLGRTTSATLPDGNLQVTAYDLNAVTATDEAGKSIKRISNALGQLTDVYENPASLNFHTAYTYNPKGDLLSVVQSGASGNTPRTRYFNYDSLSRLTSGYNPESGTICYGIWSGSSCVNGYDENSNLLHKTSPRGITINYAYDALNRITDKTFSGESTNHQTPNKHYYYDQSTGWSGTQYNTRGRLSQVTTDRDLRYYGSGSPLTCANQTSATANYNATNSNPARCTWTDELYSYDQMGRPWRISTAFPSEAGWSAHGTEFAYDFAGHTIAYRFPDGRLIGQSFDSLGRLSEVRLAAMGTTGLSPEFPYASNFTYTPAGAQEEVTLGNGTYIHTPFNSRQQQCQTWSANFTLSQIWVDNHIYFGGSEAFCGNASGNNGNITQIKDWKSSSRTQYFTYDNLNRMASFSTGGASQSYSIDAFGNLSQSGTLSSALTFDAGNRINSGGYSYDAAGNIVAINNGVTTTGYDFDGEENLFRGGPAFYSFDGNGQRMRKDPDNSGSAYTEYEYVNGQAIAERHADGTWSDYIFANGKRIAKADTYDQRIHLHGHRCDPGSCGTQTAAWSIPFPSYTVQSGDKVSWRQYQNGGAIGGLTLSFSNGNTNWVTSDTAGQVMNNLSTQGTWVNRTVDLSAFAGGTMNAAWVGVETQTSSGDWDEYFGEIAIYKADGTVLPIYNRADSIGLSFFGTSGMTSLYANIDRPVGLWEALLPQYNTTYYVGDHLGSVSLELAPGGWPESMTRLYPFGQTMADSAQSHYKFTDKERDAETGLDYFGARYYGSSMGRWMSPDWSAVPQAVPYANLTNPQTLNLYSYVSNNPLSQRDLDGHAAPPYLDSATDQMSIPDVPTTTHGRPICICATPRSFKLPANPTGLGPGWTQDTGHRNPNGSKWVNEDGWQLDFHHGNGKKGSKGKDDHWHLTPPGSKKSEAGQDHLAPGTEVTVTIPDPEPTPEPPHAGEPSTSMADFSNWVSDHKGLIIGGGVVAAAVLLAPETGGASLLLLAAP